MYLSWVVEAKRITELIDAVDFHERSVLAWAVEYGWANAAVALLKYGVDPHQLRQSMRDQLSLLHLTLAGPASVQSANGLLDIIKILLQVGVNVNTTDHED